MFFGAAAVCQGTRFFQEKIDALGVRGEVAPGLVIARFLLAAIRGNTDRVVPVPIGIEADENSVGKRDYLLVLVSTLERLFLGMYPFWGQEDGPLHFSALGARPQKLLHALPHLVRGRRSPYGSAENGYFSHNVHELRLTLDSEFALDGELYTPDPRLGPVVLRKGGQASFLRL
jgi:hypothetical protein